MYSTYEVGQVIPMNLKGILMPFESDSEAQR